MRRLLTILTLTTIVGLPSWARFAVSCQSDDFLLEERQSQIQDIESKNSTSWGRDTTRGKQKVLPIGVFQWKIDKRLGTVIPAENTDTAVHNFQNWKMQDGMTGSYSHIGNTGSARLSRIFMDRKEDRDFIFLTPLDYFRNGVADFMFTNTKSPITNIAYHSCGNKQNGEDRVRGNFATNINKISGIGFCLDYNYARGYYSNQQNSQFGAILYGYYRGDRYNMHAYINANHMKNAENGGLVDDSYITEPWKYQQKFGSKDIPVNLYSTWNRNDDQNYYLTHRYNMGYDREIVVPDSLKPQPPTDSELLYELDDSIRVVLSSDSVARKFAIDSLRTKWENELVKPTEFVPVASIIHTFQMRNLDHTFFDQGNNSGFYTNKYWGGSGDIMDITNVMSVRNTIGLAMNEGFRKWVKMGLTFFATHEYRKYAQPVHMPDTAYQSNDSEHEVLIGAEIRKAEGKTLHYNANGEFCLAGPNVGDFNIQAEGDLNFRLGKRDTATFVVLANIQNQKPTYLLRNYRNAYVHWDNNNLSRQFRTGVQGEIKYSRTRTKLRFGWENLTNYTYLAMKNTLKPGASIGSVVPGDYTHSVAVRQSDASVQVFTASISQDLVWKFLGWENEVTFQHSTNQDVLPLPSVNIYSNLYLHFRIAKVLRVQLGGDIRFFTSYYAPDYFGAVGQFAVQDANNPRMKIGKYPIVNVYANLHLKHCRIYVNAAHVNAGSGNMFLAPHMPMNPLTINFGVSWNFFN
ncbi:MAG: putative porin [Bacteroidaceae bacterium]|nr:putative porin [Bacteroidaceae bacterium]